MALVQIGECVFDEQQHGLSHGFETLDSIAQEAFVNHRHLASDNATAEADRIIALWAAEMRARWTDRVFRIYRQVEPAEVTNRFHQVRHGVPNWCELGVEVITIPG